MAKRNQIISKYKNKNSDSKIITLERSNIEKFFLQKEFILDQPADIIITEYLPEERILSFDKSFTKLIIEKGVIIKNSLKQKGKLLSFLYLNAKTTSLIKQTTGFDVINGKYILDNEIISHEFCLFDLNTISEITKIHTRISSKTKIIIVSKLLPNYIENIIDSKKLIHVKDKSISLRKLIEIITSDYTSRTINSIDNENIIKSVIPKNDNSFSEIKIKELNKVSQHWNEITKLEFSKFKILDLLENQTINKIKLISDILNTEENHIAITSLLNDSEISRKKLLNSFWHNFKFSKHLLKNEIIYSIDEEKLKNSINLLTKEIINTGDSHYSSITGNAIQGLLSSKRFLVLLKSCSNIPKELFDSNLKDLVQIDSFPILSLIFYFKSDELINFKSKEFLKLPPIIRHFTYFKFSKFKKVPHLEFDKFKNDTLDPNIHPISLCLRFTRFHKLRNLTETEEKLIFLRIMEFAFSSNFEFYSHCYFTNSLFLYFSHKCNNKFFKNQINLLISDTKLCLEKLKFFLDILENFEPPQSPE